MIIGIVHVLCICSATKTLEVGHSYANRRERWQKLEVLVGWEWSKSQMAGLWSTQLLSKSDPKKLETCIYLCFFLCGRCVLSFPPIVVVWREFAATSSRHFSVVFAFCFFLAQSCQCFVESLLCFFNVGFELLIFKCFLQAPYPTQLFAFESPPTLTSHTVHHEQEKGWWYIFACRQIN